MRYQQQLLREALMEIAPDGLTDDCPIRRERRDNGRIRLRVVDTPCGPMVRVRREMRADDKVALSLLVAA